MKLKRLIIFVSILVIISSIALPFTASAEATTVTYSSNIVYSDTSNSGTRHVVCTSTEGTGISDYYTGDNSIYEFASLKGDTLMKALRTFMTQTHKKTSSYADCKNLATKTDCENGDGRIVTIYTSHSATFNDFQGGTGWNREHVWPKSLGGFETSGGGADLHHIRPSESKTNSDRSNQKYGYVSSGKDSIGNLSGLIGGKDDNNYYEPNDNVKGDVARICLYVYVRWGGTYAKSNNLTNGFESIDVLLEWCALDPVDTWEMVETRSLKLYRATETYLLIIPSLLGLCSTRRYLKIWSLLRVGQ